MRKIYESPVIPYGMADVEDILHIGPTNMVRLWAKPGCEAETHTHTEDFEILMVEKGHGLIVWIDGNRTELGEGQNVICPKGSTHSWLNTSPATVQILSIKSKY